MCGGSQMVASSSLPNAEIRNTCSFVWVHATSSDWYGLDSLGGVLSASSGPDSLVGKTHSWPGMTRSGRGSPRHYQPEDADGCPHQSLSAETPPSCDCRHSRRSACFRMNGARTDGSGKDRDRPKRATRNPRHKPTTQPPQRTTRRQNTISVDDPRRVTPQAWELLCSTPVVRASPDCGPFLTSAGPNSTERA